MPAVEVYGFFLMNRGVVGLDILNTILITKVNLVIILNVQIITLIQADPALLICATVKIN